MYTLVNKYLVSTCWLYIMISAIDAVDSFQIKN